MKRFYLSEKDDSTKLTQCTVTVSGGKATLSWAWPADRSIRLCLVFRFTGEPLGIDEIVETGHHYDVIMRDLSAEFNAVLSDEPCRFVLCPAFFDENSDIAICNPSFVTERVYKKTIISPKIEYSKITMSQYQKVAFSMPNEIDPLAIYYTICENDRVLETYNFDKEILESGGFLFLKKDMRIVINIKPEFAHLYEFGGIMDV